MNKATSLISKIALGSIAFLSSGAAVLAESYEDLFETYSTSDYSTSSDALSGAMGTLFAGGFGVFGILIICGILIGCVLFVFNVWMLIDVFKRTEAQLPNRTLWIVLLIAGLLLGFGGIAAVVYYFSEKKKLDKK